MNVKDSISATMDSIEGKESEDKSAKKMCIRDRFVPWTSDDNTSWPEHYLMAYENYIKVYDFYKSYGLESVDGFGSPLLILTDYCD